MPKISVIVPIYKVEAYLRRCVDSILNQTFTDFEVILVDDGSPDGCPAICDEYAQKDSRVVVIHQKNGGLSAARNAGIDWAFENSDSQWICFIDSDDWVHPRFLEYLSRAVSQDNVRIGVCGINKVDSWIQYPVFSYSCNTMAAMDYYINGKSAVLVCNKIFNRELFREIRFPYGKLYEDAFTTYKILWDVGRICIIDADMYYYYSREGSIMNSMFSVKSLQEVDAWEEQFRFFVCNHRPAAKRSLELLMYVCFQKIQQAMLEDGHKKSINALRWKIRSALAYYWLHFGAYSARRYSFIYETAFPNLMKIYWKGMSIKNKLEHITRK